MKKRVMVVDSETRLRGILERVLSERGYEIEAASTGREALQQIPEFNPHMVIAEVALPEMDGFELCRRIREDSRFGAVRFIFLSAKDNREDEIEGLNLGADDYITRPVDIDKLIARVQARLRWLDNTKITGEGSACEGILEGSLAGKNLIDILQIIEMGQKRGILAVSYDQQKALISIDAGIIISAECGDEYGENAVYKALSWGQGRFCFTPTGEVAGQDAIQITHILLEWARASDEEGRDQTQADESVGENSAGEDSVDEIDDFIKYIQERERKEE